MLNAGNVWIDQDGGLRSRGILISSNHLSLSAGVFVNYRNGVLTLADCRYYWNYATHFVYYADSNILILVDSVDGVTVTWATNRGLATGGPFFVHEEGKVTDVFFDLRRSDGRRHAGVEFIQRVGYSQDGTDHSVFIQHPES